MLPPLSTDFLVLQSHFHLQVSHFYLDLGAAYGTAKAGIGISSMGVLKPDLIVKSVVPVVMAGILGIYGLIISVILLQKVRWFYTRFHITQPLLSTLLSMGGNILLQVFVLDSALSAQEWQLELLET